MSEDWPEIYVSGRSGMEIAVSRDGDLRVRLSPATLHQMLVVTGIDCTYRMSDLLSAQGKLDDIRSAIKEDS